MKYLFSCILVGLLIGCYKPPAGPGTINVDGWWEAKPYQTVVIDGCDYLVVRGFREFTVTHKGNCSNPIHQTQ